MSEMNGDTRGYAPEKYALSGKIMLSAIVILFAVVVLILCLHVYARWFIARSRRRERTRRRRAHIIFTSDIPSSATISHGLDASLVKSLPTFVYTSNTHGEVLECAVCLSEFEEKEEGRSLPKCNHNFHIACIDMWFHSHSTCPLCRSPVVNPETTQPENDSTQIEIVIESTEPQPNPTNPGLFRCEHGENEMGSCSSSNSSKSTSVGSRRKGFEKVGVSIEVPRRNQSFKISEEEMNQRSAVGSQAFKSPGGRILSFKRMLSRDRRPSPTSMSCSSAIGFDLEKGETEEQIRAQLTPYRVGHIDARSNQKLLMGIVREI